MPNELDVEILAPGKWNGTPITQDDLRSVEVAFSKLGKLLDVPLKFGHNDEQPMTDGQPALGWVKDVKVVGKKLVATFIDMPDIVYKALKKKLYKKVSVELLFGVEHKGDYYSAVLSGVALLGADIPAVNTLSDLQAFMSNDLHFEKQTSFSTLSGNLKKEDIVMSDKENEELRKQLAESQAREAKFKADADAETKKREEAEAKFRADQEARIKAEAEAKFTADKAAFAADLEAKVKDHKMTPAQRDKLTADIDTTDGLEKAKFAADLITGSKDVDTGEDGKVKKKSNDAEDGKRPDQIILSRANELRIKSGNKVSFAAAQQQVMENDPELAREWADQNGIQ